MGCGGRFYRRWSKRTAIGSHRIFARMGCFVVNREQFFFIEYKFLAGITGKVIDACQFDRIDGAGFFAHPAINATKLVDRKRLRELVPILPVWIVLGRWRGNDLDAVGRTGGLAHVTRDAFDSPLFIPIKPMHTPIIGWNFRFDFRVLTGGVRAGKCVPQRCR